MYTTLRERIEVAIAEPLKKARYIYRRYKQPFCLVLVAMSDPVDIEWLRTFLRYTDELIRVDDHHFMIFLSLVGEKNGGYKAAENILNQLENHLSHTRFHLGVACKDRDSQQDIVTRVIYALSCALDHKENFISDDYGID